MTERLRSFKQKCLTLVMAYSDILNALFEYINSNKKNLREQTNQTCLLDEAGLDETLHLNRGYKCRLKGRPSVQKYETHVQTLA